MSESLWNDIDGYLETNLLADLGAGSGYGSLFVAQVHNTHQWTPERWTLPAVAFNGNEAASRYGTQHDGYPQEEPTYEYVVTAVVKESAEATARTNAKILCARLRESLRVRFGMDGLGASTLGEAIIETRVPEWAVYVFPVENTKFWYGVARVALEIVTEL